MKIKIQELQFFLSKNIIGIEPYGHSSFYHTFKVITDTDQFFIKCTDQQHLKKYLDYEYKGLEVLSTIIPSSIPRIFSFGEYDATTFLITQYVSIGSTNHNSPNFAKAAVQLAQLHAHQSVHFGLEYDNAIGSLIQKNKQHADWATFYIQFRLLPQIELLKSNGNKYLELIHFCEELIKRVPDLLNHCVPSLLHGDLWSGNLMFNEQGDPYFIDPAISYGHFEVDIAMSKLFGGFSDLFYQTYFEFRPKENGYEDRIRLYQIYFLLVHVNIFGLSYLAQTITAIRKLI